MGFKIGNIDIKNKVVLAPMAGISNPAYMKIVEEFGCGYAVTELISSEAIIRDNKKTFDMLNGIEKLKMPVAIQIFGSNPDTMANAAKIITSIYKNVIIDINMGCPVVKVAVRSQAGSALLKNPDKVKQIVSSVVNAVDVPVTVKIRSGWDSNSINAVEIAKIIEEAGASCIAVHPRTRSQLYTGIADWKIIKEVKSAVSIPVIGNGDIKNCYDAARMLEETGCDAVMIGRACMGNPWIIRDCVEFLENKKEPQKVLPIEKIQMIKKHFNNLIETKNERLALKEIRSHASWYLKGINNSNLLKEKLFKCSSKQELLDLLDDFIREEKIYG